jgi:ubiquitin-activating enzyme E1
MVAVIGGFVAQEVLEASSVKSHPMAQSMYFDFLESLPSELPTKEDCQPINSRYDSQMPFLAESFSKRSTSNVSSWSSPVRWSGNDENLEHDGFG